MKSEMKSSCPFSSIQTDVCVTIIQHIFVLFLTFTCFTSLCFCVQVVVPTRVGQVYVYDSVKPGQDEYDVPPRHQPPTQQDIYDVPPTRQQYNTQVRLVGVCVSVCECLCVCLCVQCEVTTCHLCYSFSLCSGV